MVRKLEAKKGRGMREGADVVVVTYKHPKNDLGGWTGGKSIDKVDTDEDIRGEVMTETVRREPDEEDTRGKDTLKGTAQEERGSKEPERGSGDEPSETER